MVRMPCQEAWLLQRMPDYSCKLGCTMSMVKWPNVPKLIMVQPLLALGIVSQEKENQNQETDFTFSTQKKTKPKNQNQN